MPEFLIEKYTDKQKSQWDNFVKNSPNTSFLFLRDFMSYHADRFQDFSLLIYRGKKLFAVLPGHQIDRQFASHLGLTYGGLLLNKKQKTSLLEQAFNTLLEFLKAQNFTSLLLKQPSAVYQPQYSSAIAYFLFQKQAKLIGRDLNYVIDLKRVIPIHKSKKKILKKSYIDELEIREEADLSAFWKDILIPVLKTKYKAKPVHSIEEIKLLKERFPKHIRQFNVCRQDKIIAGMTLFITNGIVKSQYGAASEIGENYKALDYLYLKLLSKFKTENYRFFDLGTTNENKSNSYNVGLSNYKEELGAFPINQDCYLLYL